MRALYWLDGATLSLVVVVALPLVCGVANALRSSTKEPWPAVTMPAFARTWAGAEMRLTALRFFSESCDGRDVAYHSLSEVLAPLPASQQRGLLERCFPADGSMACASALLWFEERAAVPSSHCRWGVVVEEKTIGKGGEVLARSEHSRHVFEVQSRVVP